MKPIDLATLITLGALWGGSYLLIRIGAPAFGPAALMGGRVAIAAVVLSIVARAVSGPFALRPYVGRLLVLGLINAALPFTLIATAELQLNASFVAVLGATAPLFAALINAIWFGERITSTRAVGLALGLAGVAVITGWSSATVDRSNLVRVGAVLLAAVCYAAGTIYSKRRLEGIPALALARGQQLGALSWLAVPMLVMWPEARPDTGSIGALVALALLSTSMAYVLYFRLIARIGATMTSTVTYIIPAFGMLGGAVFLGEHITVPMIAGFGMIALSIVLVGGQASLLRNPGTVFRSRSRSAVSAGAAL